MDGLTDFKEGREMKEWIDVNSDEFMKIVETLKENKTMANEEVKEYEIRKN